MLKELETTSRMEGTKITFEDLILQDSEEEINSKKRSPKMETMGVMFAIDKGNEMLKDSIPISKRFIRAIHQSLIQHAQYENRNVVPGEFRNVNVRVGSYRPPEFQFVLDLMSDLEKYIQNNEINISPIVEIGIIHAQFERIHPFADGNGRIGRLLISFLLKEYGITSNVHYFMSPYIEKNKNPYYDSLQNLEDDDGWDKWVEAFLGMVVGSSNYTIERIEQLIALYMNGDFLDFYNKNSRHIKNFIFTRPMFTVSGLRSDLLSVGVELSVNTLKNSKDIALVSQGKGRSENIYRCDKIMDVLTDF